jgi:hypothetical protein
MRSRALSLKKLYEYAVEFGQLPQHVKICDKRYSDRVQYLNYFLTYVNKRRWEDANPEAKKVEWKYKI